MGKIILDAKTLAKTGDAIRGVYSSATLSSKNWVVYLGCQTISVVLTLYCVYILRSGGILNFLLYGEEYGASLSPIFMIAGLANTLLFES